jgi:hypothetical protein
MEKFTYTVEAKITAWEETTYTFHAENKEKAEEIIKQVVQEGIMSIKDEKLQSELDDYRWEIMEDTIGDLDSKLQPYEIYDEHGNEIESGYRTI